MPRALTRPTPVAIAELRQVIDLERSLPERERRRLRLVLAWAQGATFREAATLTEMVRRRIETRRVSTSTVAAAVRQYCSKGLDSFLAERPARGRARIPVETRRQIADALRDSIAQGRPLPYARLAAAHRVSVGIVAQVALANRLDAKHRTGPTGPLGESQGKEALL